MITKNHKTTTVLVALVALSAILVAGSVAAASDHFAFAHKKGKKSFENSGIAVPTITAQEQECTARWWNLSNNRCMYCHLDQYGYRIWRRCRRTINEDKTHTSSDPIRLDFETTYLPIFFLSDNRLHKMFVLSDV